MGLFLRFCLPILTNNCRTGKSWAVQVSLGGAYIGGHGL